jgi:hypothetical protein
MAMCWVMASLRISIISTAATVGLARLMQLVLLLDALSGKTTSSNRASAKVMGSRVSMASKASVLETQDREQTILGHPTLALPRLAPDSKATTTTT